MRAAARASKLGSRDAIQCTLNVSEPYQDPISTAEMRGQMTHDKAAYLKEQQRQGRRSSGNQLDHCGPDLLLLAAEDLLHGAKHQFDWLFG